jgi:hypothetical protein
MGERIELSVEMADFSQVREENNRLLKQISELGG